MGKRWIVFGEEQPDGTVKELGRVETIEGRPHLVPRELRNRYQDAVEIGMNRSWIDEEHEPQEMPGTHEPEPAAAAAAPELAPGEAMQGPPAPLPSARGRRAQG